MSEAPATVTEAKPTHSFYASETHAKAIDEQRARPGMQAVPVQKFKGQRFTEVCPYGTKPISRWADLQKLGDGLLTDITREA